MCAPHSCLLPHTQFYGDAHARCRIYSQNSTTQPGAQQMGPWPTARQEQSCKPRAPTTDLILPSLPDALLTRTDPRDALQWQQQSRPCMQTGPAPGRGCPLDAQVTLCCLMESGCLQQPLTPRRGESSNKKLWRCPFRAWERLTTLDWGCQSLQR